MPKIFKSKLYNIRTYRVKGREEVIKFQKY